MEANEQLAYCCWEFLSVTKVTDRLKGKVVLNDDEFTQGIVARKRLSLEESTNKSYPDKITLVYSPIWKSSTIPMFKAMVKTKAAAGINPQYRGSAEIAAKSRLNITPSYALQSWLRIRNMMAFLSMWEKQYNPDYLTDEAEANY